MDEVSAERKRQLDGQHHHATARASLRASVGARCFGSRLKQRASEARASAARGQLHELKEKISEQILGDEVGGLGGLASASTGSIGSITHEYRHTTLTNYRAVDDGEHHMEHI